MKKGILVFISFSTLLFTACKENKTDAIKNDIVQENSVTRVPNLSDTYFSNAVQSLYDQDFAKTSENLKKGVMELRKEGSGLKGQNKINLNRYTEYIDRIISNLENKKVVSLDNLKEAIANAEINIAHNYLTTTDTYVIESPESVKRNASEKKFNKTLDLLQKQQGKWDKNAQKVGDSLLTAGKKLNQEYLDWQKKADAFSKKAESHFKDNVPKVYDEYFITN